MGKRSPLVRGRGLKLPSCSIDPYFLSSPLVRGRGLKRLLRQDVRSSLVVAPRAGAWIETYNASLELWID